MKMIKLHHQTVTTCIIGVLKQDILDIKIYVLKTVMFQTTKNPD